MRTRIRDGRGALRAGLGIAALLAAGAAGAGPEKWVFAMNRFSKDGEVAYVSNVVTRAKACGMTGICLLSGDGYTSWYESVDRDLPTREYVGNAAGLESWDKWLPERKARFNRIRAYCDSIGFEIIPLLWSPGYFSMRFENPGWVAVFPVKDVACTAKGGRITCAGRRLDPPVVTRGTWLAANGEKILELDIDRLHAAGAAAAASVRFKAKPYTRYRASVKFATKGFTGRSYEPCWPTLTFDVGDGICSGGVSRKCMTSDQDWTPHVKEINSLHHTELTLGIGSYTDRARGKLYVKDIVIEECGIDQPVKREGCPFTVRDAETGRVYEEGRDYARVPYMKALAWPAFGEPITFEAVKGGAIRDGAKLLVSAYEPPRAMARQFSVCPSAKGLGGFMTKAAENVVAATGSQKMFLSLDEIRNECLCETCVARKTDIAHKMGAHVTECVETILRRFPGATLYAWPDMLNPHGNPRAKHYYNCSTSWQGIWDLIPGPDKLRVVYWGGRPNAAEVDFFAKRGYRGLAAGYYDYDPELKDPPKWAAAMNAHPGAFDGWMYTTWEHRHGQLEAYAKILDDAWTAPKLVRPATAAARECWFWLIDRLESEGDWAKATNLVERASKSGYNACALSGPEDIAFNPARAARARALVAYAAARGIEIIPAPWNFGYGGSISYRRSECIETTAAKGVAYRVAKGVGRFVPHRVETGFEGKTLATNFTFVSKGRLKPNRTYALRLRLKTEGLDPVVYHTVRGNLYHSDRGWSARGPWELYDFPVKATQDWKPYEWTFNTYDDGEATIAVYLSKQVTKAGCCWFDSIEIVERPIGYCRVETPGCAPVVRAADGRIYIPGKDYEPFAPPKPVRSKNPELVVKVLPGSAIREGETLLVDAEVPAIEGAKQYSVCPSAPCVKEYLRTSAKAIEDVFHPRRWLFSVDEWRVANLCPLCRARGVSPGRLIGECIADMAKAVREVNPKAEVAAWADMVCPLENAGRNPYYCVDGSLGDSWKYLPKDLIMVPWMNGRSDIATTKWLMDRGFRCLAGGYYNRKDNFAADIRWRDACKDDPKFLGMMFTTWGGAFADGGYYDMEAYGRMVHER